jgi:low affinity Fe/Cu permease
MALQLKLDELIMATKGARNSVAGIEDSSDEELNGAKEALRRRQASDTSSLWEAVRDYPRGSNQGS